MALSKRRQLGVLLGVTVGVVLAACGVFAVVDTGPSPLEDGPECFVASANGEREIVRGEECQRLIDNKGIPQGAATTGSP